MAVNLVPTSLDVPQFGQQPDAGQNSLLLSYLKAQKQKQETLAQRLSEQASSTAPVYSTAQGLARILTGGLAAYNDKLDKDEANASAAARLKAFGSMSGGSMEKPAIPDITGPTTSGSSGKEDDDEKVTGSVGDPAAYANLLRRTSPDDLDTAARTIAAEAGNQGTNGMAAVAHVMANRANLTGKSLNDIITQPHQFEAFDNGSADKYDPGHPAYDKAYQIAQQVVSGQRPDPTNGATNYLNPQLQAQLGRRQPDWAPGDGQRIGDHVFYKDWGYNGRSQRGAPTAMNGTGFDGMPTMSDEAPVGMPPQQNAPWVDPPAKPEAPVANVGGAPQDWRTGNNIQPDNPPMPPPRPANLGGYQPQQQQQSPVRQAAASVSNNPRPPSTAPNPVPMAPQAQQTDWANNSLNPNSRDGGAGEFARSGMGSPPPAPQMTSQPAPQPQPGPSAPPPAPMPPQRTQAPVQAPQAPQTSAPGQAPDLGGAGQAAYRAAGGAAPQGDVQLPGNVRADFAKQTGRQKSVTDDGSWQQIQTLTRQAQFAYATGDTATANTLLQQANTLKTTGGRTVTYDNGAVMFFPWIGQPKTVTKAEKDAADKPSARFPTAQEQAERPGLKYFDNKGNPHFEQPKPFESDLEKARNEPIKEAIKQGHPEAITRSKMAVNVMADAMKSASENGGKLPQGIWGPRIQDLKSALASFGVDTANIAEGDLVNKFNNILAMADTRALTSRPAVFEVVQNLRNNPGLSMTEQGRAGMLYLLNHDLKQREAAYRIAQDKSTNNENFGDRMLDWQKRNPVYSPFRRDQNGKPIPLEAAEDQFPNVPPPSGPAPKRLRFNPKTGDFEE
jgi:hypothetical protein